jgi:hypothetical protein
MMVEEESSNRLVVSWSSDGFMLLGAGVFGGCLFWFLSFASDRSWLDAILLLPVGALGVVLMAKPSSSELVFDRQSNTVTSNRTSLLGLFQRRKTARLSSALGIYRINDPLEHPIRYFFVPKWSHASRLWLRIDGEKDMFVARYYPPSPNLRKVEKAIRRIIDPSG